MREGSMTKFPVTFFQQIPAGTNKMRLEYEAPDNMMIERLRFLPYTGQERTLKVWPYIIYRGTSRLRSLIQMGRQPDGTQTDAYLAGNGIEMDLPISITMRAGDKILLMVSNESAYDYDLDLLFIMMDLEG